MHPLLGTVFVRFSNRAQRISIRVTSSGRVSLVIPRNETIEQAACFLDSKIEWVKRALVRQQHRQVLLPKSLSEQERRERIEELRRRAKEDLPWRIDLLSKATGLHYTQLTLRLTRSKWGSCSSRNSISLNICLAGVPEHLRDYVILHELCHTLHHNHSQAFHDLVNRLTQGRERELEKELRQYAISD